MTEKLQELINNGSYMEARNLANKMYEEGEQSETFWILNAEIYRVEGQREAGYACITRGLQKNPYNYELYYMLGEYYKSVNMDQAYLCMEQAEYYCHQSEDVEVIHAAKEEMVQSGRCQVHPVSIVILSYNSKDIMKGCVESIRKTCPLESYELVVVDNASTDGITDWLRGQEDIVLQCNTENMGFAGGCNQGIELSAAANDIMLLNNDTVVPPNAIFWLRMGLYERAQVGAVGPLTNYAGNDQQIVGEFHTREEYLDLATQICMPAPNAYENKVWLGGFAMLIKRAAVDKVGMLDTQYTWGNFEDKDYGMMLTQAGYELLLCYNSFIYHYGSLNMAKDKQKYLNYIKENGEKLKEKWGFDSARYNLADQTVLAQITENKKQPICVLQVGCGWGATLARMKYQYPNARVYGIEEAGLVARFGHYLAEITAGDVAEMQLPYQEEYFDYIVIGEEICTRSDVGAICQKLKKYLKKSGKMIGAEKDKEEKETRSFMTSSEEYREKILNYREKSYEYLKKIDECLKNRTAASITEFLHIFQEKELLEHCLSCIPELSYAHIFSVITVKEIQKRKEISYLLNGNSVRELTEVLKRVEFRIWELEFERTPEAENHLYETMQQYFITPEAMSCIIVVSAMDKCDIYLTVSCIYLEHQGTEAAIDLLVYALEWYPEDERILQVLVSLYKKTGKQELAESYEEKLKCVQQ